MFAIYTIYRNNYNFETYKNELFNYVYINQQCTNENKWKNID